MKFEITNKTQKFAIFALIILDQIIKLLVKKYYGMKLPIFYNVIYFNPILNKYYSWFSVLLKIKINIIFHILFTISTIFLMYYFYKFCYYKHKDDLIIRVTEILWFSGSLCSLLDKLFWNGSLDYILIKKFFVFDLKDVYLSFFQVGIFILVLRNWTKLNNINSKQLISQYFNFVKECYKKR